MDASVSLLWIGKGGGDSSPQIYTGQGLGLLSLRLPLRWQEGRGTSFICFGLVVRVCLLWCVLEVVGAASGQIYLHKLYSHTGDDLHGGVLE
jgi:hypothetical protein